jgi:hypothetical protein
MNEINSFLVGFGILFAVFWITMVIRDIYKRIRSNKHSATFLGITIIVGLIIGFVYLSILIGSIAIPLLQYKG